jgi:hypothetical protein
LITLADYRTAPHRARHILNTTRRILAESPPLIFRRAQRMMSF